MRYCLTMLIWAMACFGFALGPGSAGTKSVTIHKGIDTFPWIYRAQTIGNDSVTFDYGNIFPYIGRYTADQFATLHAAGADFIRVPVEPSPFLGATPSQRSTLIQTVLGAIHAVTDQGMTAVIDMHPRNDVAAWSGDAIMSSPTLLGAYKTTLVQFAKTLNANGPSNVVLELMNEPPGGYGAGESYSWLNTQIDLVRSIRAVAPTLTLLLTGDQGGSIAGLLRLDPTLFDSPYMLYSFHYYDPMVITHQGATWGSQPARQYLSGIAYPPIAQTEATNFNTVEASINAAPLSPADKGTVWSQAQAAIVSYYQTNQGIKTIRSDFTQVTTWAKTYRIPASRIVLGEFGITRPGAPHQTALNYTHDVRQTAEDDGFAWAYHNYSPVNDPSTQGFSILRLQGPTPMAFDAGIVQRGLGWAVPKAP